MLCTEEDDGRSQGSIPSNSWTWCLRPTHWTSPLKLLRVVRQAPRMCDDPSTTQGASVLCGCWFLLFFQDPGEVRVGRHQRYQPHRAQCGSWCLKLTTFPYKSSIFTDHISSLFIAEQLSFLFVFTYIHTCLYHCVLTYMFFSFPTVFVNTTGCDHLTISYCCPSLSQSKSWAVTQPVQLWKQHNGSIESNAGDFL